MNSVSRRQVFQFAISGNLLFLSGCNMVGRRSNDNEVPAPRLRLYLDREQTDAGWEMTVRARHVNDWDTSIHDVTVIAFNEHGEDVCTIPIGDSLQHGSNEKTETVDCDGFPAIVTATAEESPCDGAQIRMLYYTSEQDPETVDDLNHHSFWEGRWRDCDEELPPEHVLDEVRQSGAAQ